MRLLLALFATATLLFGVAACTSDTGRTPEGQGGKVTNPVQTQPPGTTGPMPGMTHP